MPTSGPVALVLHWARDPAPRSAGGQIDMSLTAKCHNGSVRTTSLKIDMVRSSWFWCPWDAGETPSLCSPSRLHLSLRLISRSDWQTAKRLVLSVSWTTPIYLHDLTKLR